MPQKMWLLIVAMLSLLGGYIGAIGPASWNQPVEARSTIMPDQPQIVFLAAPGAQHGLFTEATWQSKGVTLYHDWKTVQVAGTAKPLDALLFDPTALASAGDAERAWVQAQMKEGTVVGGVGVDLKQLATMVGVPTLRAPGEADIPLGDDGYLLFYAYAVGKSEDAQRWQRQNILARMLSGENAAPTGIEGYMQTANGKARGELSSEQGVNVFFLDLKSQIVATYQMRVDYAQAVKESAGESK